MKKLNICLIVCNVNNANQYTKSGRSHRKNLRGLSLCAFRGIRKVNLYIFLLNLYSSDGIKT
jgi:hypothetical protein